MSVEMVEEKDRSRYQKRNYSVSERNLETLTDGIFAIVMTIIVLEISVAKISDGDIDEQLIRLIIYEIPAIFAYIISFIVLAFFWMSNHRHSGFFVELQSNTMAWITILFLMAIALIPFSAELISDYGTHWPADAFYAANMLLPMCILTYRWDYAYKNKMMLKAVTSKQFKQARLSMLTSCMIFSSALVLTLLDVPFSWLLYVLLPFAHVYIRKKNGGRICID